MKLLKLLFVTTSIALILPKLAELKFQMLNIEALKRCKAKLEELLISMTHERIVANSNTTEELYLIPRTLLNPDGFAKLGLDRLVSNSSIMNLTINKDKYSESLLVPNNAKSLFVFNSNKASKVPKGEINLATFLDSAPPFQIPEMTDLVDYYLLFPKSYLQAKLIEFGDLKYSSFVVKSNSLNLPLFRRSISDGQPLIVFMFEQNSLNQDKLTSVMNIQNYLPLNGQVGSISTFFDNFASSWIENVGYQNLVHSVFCMTSNDTGYCLRIPNNKLVELLSLFNSKKYQKGDLADGDDDANLDIVFNSQVITQISKTVKKATDVLGKAVADSRESIQDADSRLDSQIKQFVGADNEYELRPTLLRKVKNEKRNQEVVKKIDLVQNRQIDKTNLSEWVVLPLALLRMNEPEIESPRSKKFTQVYYPLGNEEDEFGSSADIYLTPHVSSGGSFIKEVEDLGHDSRKVFSSDLPVSANAFPKLIPQNFQDGISSGHLRPLKVRPVKAEAFQRFSNITKNLAKRDVPLMEDCEKVTWFNVFHHSIFGKPKFCMEVAGSKS